MNTSNNINNNESNEPKATIYAFHPHNGCGEQIRSKDFALLQSMAAFASKSSSEFYNGILNELKEAFPAYDFSMNMAGFVEVWVDVQNHIDDSLNHLGYIGHIELMEGEDEAEEYEKYMQVAEEEIAKYEEKNKSLYLDYIGFKTVEAFATFHNFLKGEAEEYIKFGKIAHEAKVEAIKAKVEASEANDEETAEDAIEGAKEIVEYVLPTWCASALINDDYSGLSDEDEEALKAFVDKIGGMCIDAEVDNAYFTHGNDLYRNMGDDVCKHTFIVKK